MAFTVVDEIRLLEIPGLSISANEVTQTASPLFDSCCKNALDFDGQFFIASQGNASCRRTGMYASME